MKVEPGITSTIEGSRNDCTVRAVANAFNMSYDQAAATCKAYGRKRKNCGMRATALITLIEAHGAKKMTGTDNRQMPAWLQVASLPSDKTFLVMLLGHVFVVKNGTVMDGNSSETWHRRIARRRVVGVWEVL